MPAAKKDRKVIVTTMVGAAAYDRYMDRLEREAGKRGLTVRGRSALVEYALNVLGLSWGIRAPARVLPVGSNRFTKGAAKKSEKGVDAVE